MVSLLGYTIEFYTWAIYITYGLLVLLGVIRFFSERSKGVIWIFTKGVWTAASTWRYLYILPIMIVPLYVFLYTLDFKLGFVLITNGVLCALIVVELLKWGLKHW